MRTHVLLILLILVVTAFVLSGCCYQQPYGPEFEDELKAEKDKNWFFGFNTMGRKPIITAPLLLNDRLYVTGMGGMLYCVDKDKGQPVNGFEFNGGRPLKAGFRSKPVTDGSTIFVTSFDHNLYGIDPTMGTRKQLEFATDGQIEAAPVLMGGKIYVANWSGKLYCIDKTNLQQDWVFEADAAIRCTPVAFNGRIYFGDKSGRFYCVAAGSQPELVWGDFKAGGEIYGEPVTDGEFVWLTSLDGNVYCLDAATGEKIWVFETDGEFWAGPHIDKTIPDFGEITTGSAGELSIGEVETIITPEGDVEIISTDQDGGETLVTIIDRAAVARHTAKARLYVGSMNAHFYILDAYTGKPATFIDIESGEEKPVLPIKCGDGVKWDHGIRGTAVTDANYVYFGSGDFYFRAADKRTGLVKWLFDIRGEVWGQPLVYEGKVVFGCEDTYFYGVSTETGGKIKGVKQ